MTLQDAMVCLAFAGGMAIGILIGWLEWGAKLRALEQQD